MAPVLEADVVRDFCGWGAVIVLTAAPHRFGRAPLLGFGEICYDVLDRALAPCPIAFTLRGQHGKIR